ncbi:hypothetical protein S40285_00842 [Stachybotrys chlorohalonatus IBT 40285]|uniref:DUF962 domain-containing protein n=1 Tax=Stachybotrys chlorohalonatus (strain IBT 40285) TaxID=1283841 RepID=A0A084QJK0_STAC4|nr:hypothetical protein S40285_00842 [Stachybotrys chlorohalonata IBT 40285]
MSLDLERHLTFYGAYHRNSVNVGIHMLCVPPILITGFCMATYTGTLIPTPEWLTIPYLDLNLGTIAATLYAALYVLLEPVAGTALAILCLASTAFCNYLRIHGSASTLQVAAALHVVCWIAQFVGHGVFEGRAPALLDNLFQAIFLAPMFVWLEFLFKLGYRQELQTRVHKAVQEEVVKYRTSIEKAKAS